MANYGTTRILNAKVRKIDILKFKQNKNVKYKINMKNIFIKLVIILGIAFLISIDDNCTGCNCPYLYDEWKGGESNAFVSPKKNAYEVVMDRGTDGWKFKVGKKTLFSQHYVKDGGTVWMHRRGDVAVHDESCD